MHIVTKYALESIAKKRVVGETERMACQRHLNDLARCGQLPKGIKVKISAKYDPKFQWRFDEQKADLVLKFFRYLNHVEGIYAGQPIELIDAHKFDLGSMFGWVLS